jgi:hypothetical protein
MNKTQNNYNKKLVTSTKGQEARQVKERERDREKCKETHNTQSDVFTSVSQKKLGPHFQYIIP